MRIVRKLRVSLVALAALSAISIQVAGAVPKSDKPARSGKTDPRTAAFMKALDTAGFDVREGSTEITRPLESVNNGFIASAAGNNAGQFYKNWLVPPLPGQPDFGFVFRLNPDEAVVYVGKTPPMADYFSFCAFLWSRQYPDSCQPTGDWIFPSVHDPLNSKIIKTEGQGNPFQKNTVIILTADEGVYQRVLESAVAAGFPASMVNLMVLPSSVLRLGTGPGSDWLFVLGRTANFTSAAQEQKYLNDNNWASVYRVTPRVTPVPQRFAQPPWRNRKWIDEETLVPGLTAGLERLQAAILAKTLHTQARPLDSVRWFPDSKDALLDDPANPAYRMFLAGESSDSPYFRSGEDGQPANFVLGNDDMAVVYGVNHAAAGIAIYSSFGVYGEWTLSHCPLQPGETAAVFGANDPIWNGVVGMTNHDFTGSAEQYIPGDPMARYLYAVRVVRKSRAAARDRYSVVVPELSDSRIGPPYFTDVIPLDKPMFFGYRAYINPATNAGPAHEDIIPNRAIVFHLK